MQKTKKSIAKRFKITATGKILRRSAGKGHLLRNKSIKQKRRAGLDKPVSQGFCWQVRRAMPFA
jgi:large subunit ribosomal protein L35